MFYSALINRLAKFKLEVAEEKTNILMFGRFAAQHREKKGIGKPETFDFLGFTHYCGTSRAGKFRVKRKTSKKKFRAKVQAVKTWLKEARHEGVDVIMETMRKKLVGHYRYYGITDNSKRLGRFRYEVSRLLFKWLNRRSQRQSFNYEAYNRFLERHPLPEPRIYVNIYG
jgi:predicted metal-dependent hydrolase